MVPLRLNLSFLPGPGGKARQKYICDVCQTPVISYDLKNHYKSKTNWEQLKKLQMGEDESNIEELGDIEAHTYNILFYMNKIPPCSVTPHFFPHFRASIRNANRF